MGQIAFYVSPEVHTRIIFAGRARGYQNPALYIKAEVERLMGEMPAPATRQTRTLTVNQNVVLELLTDHSCTVAQMCRATGKLQPVLGTVVRDMLDRGWIAEDRRDVWTGGRPAANYKPTALGAQKLAEHLEQRRKQNEHVEKMAAFHAAESALRNPDLMPEKPKKHMLRSLDLTTDVGRFTQAALDSLYKVHPDAPPEVVEPIVQKLGNDALGIVSAGYSTWPEEIDLITREFPEGLIK